MNPRVSAAALRVVGALKQRLAGATSESPLLPPIPLPPLTPTVFLRLQCGFARRALDLLEIQKQSPELWEATE